jgi:hypothetical protein
LAPPGLVLAPLACGVRVGYVLGGSLRRLADAKARGLWLPWIAAALQVAHLR